MDLIERRAGEDPERDRAAGRSGPALGERVAEARPAVVDLRLRVTDPEVVAELARRPDGAERDRFALEALRIGVLALRTASGGIDAEAVRRAGDEAVARVRELLDERARDLVRDLADSLTRYLDPKTGTLPRRLEDLVRKDGDLERALRAHLGEGSRLEALFAPGSKDAVPARIAEAVEKAIEEERARILREFSLDDERSALSRFLREVSARNEKVASELSLDNPASALNRLLGNLTLDDERSALSRLRKTLAEAVSKMDEENRKFHADVRAALAEIRGREAEAARSTRHGLDFEADLGGVLAARAAAVGDRYAASGETVGKIPRCKVGDHVIELGPETAAPGARIVWEAKEVEGFTLERARAEIETARKNRGAQIGVFVFSARCAPPSPEPIQRIGPDIFLAWDAEDPSSDLLLHVAYSLARGLCVAERARTADAAEAAERITKALRQIERQAKFLNEIQRTAQTVHEHGGKIRDRAGQMAEEIAAQIAEIDRAVRGA